MKIQVKKAVEAPNNVKEVVQRISSTPLQDIAPVLRGFKWTFDKGDINHWVPVLDHFDSFLEKYASSRADLQLRSGEEGAVEEAAFPADSVLAVLNTTCCILENCSNKGAYNSTEHLSNLLAAPAMEVTAAALQVFQVLMRKTHHTAVRLAVSTGLTQRLLSLCKGWGGKEEGLELAVCASTDGTAVQKVLHKATTLHFEFTPEKPSGDPAAVGTEPDVQPVTLHVPGVDRFTEPEHVILAELVRRYKVPPAARFDLLCRIRIARNFGSLTGRRQLVHQRLLAFNVLLQCSPSAEEYNSLYLAEPEIVSELVGLVQAEEAVEEEDLRTLALKALAAQLQDRSRSSSVISAVTSGGQSGLLAMLLHKSVASILQQANVPLAPSGSGVLPSHVVAAVQRGAASSSSSAASPVEAAAAAAPAQGSVQYSVSFVDALLTLVAGLVTSSSGCQALNDAGVISALLPLLRDHHPDHLNLVCTSLKILEMYMDLSQTASTTFRDLGGLTEVIKRLAYEVGAVMGAAAESTAATPTAGDADVVMASAEQQAGLASPAAADQQAAGSLASKQLPHNRKSLLKILLRIITISSYQPTGNLSATRPVDDDAQLLYASLKAIYGRAEEFGGTLFSHAVQVMTDLIHHEPQSFRQLQEAGLPDAFLTAVKAGVFPGGECVCAFPGALVALCLNSAGLKQVRETAALNVLGDIFTAKKAMRVLTGDTPSVLGSGLEELMRFVPSLRSDGVNVVLGVFKALCILGGDEEEAAEALKPLPPEPPVATVTQASAAHLTAGAAGSPSTSALQPMDTDAAASSAVVATEQAAGQSDAGPAARAAAPQQGTGAEAAAEGMDVDVQPETAAAASTGQQPGAEAGVAPPAAAAGPAAAAANAQQERELERQRQQAEDDRLAAIAKRVLAQSLQKVAAKKDQETDVEAFLPLALTAASRMLEPLLANAETSRLFVERGGADLLLKLYKLPRLTTVFNFSSASHSLLSVFRALSGAHGTAIAAKSKEAVAQQVAVLLPMAEQVGPVCVPTLPTDVRDKYSKQVLVVQGLVALTSAVARNVSAMLPQVSMGDPPLLASMGKLERIVLAQAAASDPWKQARDAAKKAAAAAEASAAAHGGGNTAAEAAQDGGAGAGEAADAADHDGAGDEDMEGPAAEQPADRSASEAAPGAAAAATGSNNGKQKRTPEDTAYDALSYLLTSMRTFYMGTAKAIHTPVRRREETVTTPTAPMKAAALSLALLLVGNLQLRPWQQQQQPSGPGPAGSPEAESSAAEAVKSSSVNQQLGCAVAAVRCRSGHFLRVVEEVNQVLFDSRRHYCHLLVLNYFSALGGMQVYAATFKEAADLLWNLLDLQGAAQASQRAAIVSSGDQPMTDEQIGSNTSSSDGTAAAAIAGPGTAGTKDPKQIMEAVLVKMLAIYEQLANATVLLSAPQATQMLLAALPNYAGQPLVAPAKDALHFVLQLHSRILAAVLPLWSHPKVACAPPGVLTAIIRVLQTCSQGPGPASMILRYSQRPAASRAPPQPDAAMVQQIIEMGFSQARAEEALRRVGANSVELAMEWLITHSEEPAAAAGAQAGGAAATGAAAADAAATEEEELTRALLASLSVVGMSPDAVAQRNQQQQPQQQQSETEAAASAGPAEGSTAAASDQEAVTPQRTPRPVVQPGAPVLGAAAAAAAVVGSALQSSGADAAGIPAPVQLLDGAICLIATSPATAFSIADLVFTIVQREDGKDREAILERLMNDCLPPAADTASSSAAAGAVPADADVLTPARLLLLLLHKDTASRQVAAHKGLVARCLQVLESWQAQYSAAVQYFERLTSQQQQTASETKKLEIPVWVEAVLMLLEIMTTTQVKSSAAAASRTAQEAARATATAAALQATGPAAGAAASAAAAAGEDTSEAAPARSAADQAADADVQMAEQPEAAAAPAAASAAPAPPAAQEGTAHPPELQLAGMTEALANWKPCGLLDEQQQQRATSVAVTLLQQLHSHADQWDRPETSMYEADGSVPNPGSVTTVVLQLLNHLTKRYGNAQQVLAGSVHQLLLSLPAACLAPSISRQEGLIGGILRHMLEDPVTLESWMESEIKNSMSVKARDPYYSARPYYNRRNPMSRYTTAASFLTMMSSLVGRDPAVFLQAAARTCALETSGGETMVRLRTVREQQQQQSAVPSTAASRDASAAGAPPASAAAPVGAVAPGPPVAPPAGSRSAAAIESTPAAVTAQDHTVAGASERTVFKSSSRSSRKLVPASFVEVVDALLDVVLSYQGFKSVTELAQQQQQQGRLSGTAAMDVDAAATVADQQAPAAPATASEAPAKPAAAVSLDVTPLPTDLLLRQLNPVAREAGIQSMVLRLLADYCLLYNNTVGLLLKRDTDSSASDVRASLQHHHHQTTPGMQQAAGQEGSKSAAKSKKHSSAGGGYNGSGRSSMPGSSSTGAAGHDPPKAGVVLKHIMHVQLVDPIPDGTQSSASVASNASALLQAVCIRSGEGRKRLMSEVVSTLTAGADMITNDGGSKAAAGKAHHKLPYMYQQGGPEPAKVSAYVNLMGSLVQSGSSPGMSRSDPRQSSGTSMSLELLRAMREAGAVKALAQVLKLVNTDHAKAKDAINAVLKPLEVLTRPLPKQVQPAEQQELRTAQTQAAGQRRRDTALAAAQTQAPASATATTTAAVLQAPTGARQPAIAVGPPAAAAAAGHAAPAAGGATGRSSESVGSAGRAAMDEDQRPHAGEEAAGPDALAAAGRFVAGGAGQARSGGRLAGGLIDQLMEQLVDIEVELEAGAVHDDDGDVDSSASGGSADDGDVSDEGSDDSDEDMAEEAQQAQAELEGPGAMVGSEEGGVGDAPSLTEEEDDSDGEGPHAELVLDDAGAAFINPDDEAAANGALGHDMADMDSSGEPESDEDQHHHHAFDDELLPEDDMHLLPPQLDAGHHTQQDGVGDPLDEEEEEEEADEYLDDDEEHSDDDDDDARYDIDAAAEEFLNGGGRFSFDVPMAGELDDMPAALMMPGGFGRAAARRMAYRPGAAAATAGVWDDSEPGDATHDPLSGAVTVQMMLNQLGINAGSGGSVAMIGPNGRQYRMAVLAPDDPGATAGGRAGSEAMAGAMNSALYSLSTQLMPQQHRLLALPPRVPVSDSTALLESAGASVSAAASAGDAGVAGAASGLRSQASSVQALTRLLARAPEGPANPGYMRDGVRARMTAQRAGNNLFSVHLNPAALPTTLGTATNFLQSLELLQPGGLLGGPPGAGALADLDNTVWDDAVNQLLEALAPQGVGRARASAGPPGAPGAARAGGAVEEAGLDPRSLESQMLALLRAHGPPQQPQQQQQPDQRLQDAQGPATAAGQPQPAQAGAAASTEAGAAAVTDASGAGQPSGRRTLTEEVVAAAFRAAMHEDQPVAAEAAPAPEQPQQQQQQQIQAAAEITSHPVEVPPSAPESDTEGDAGGSTQGDQLAPMDTEDAPQQPAAASTGGQPAADAGESGAEAAQGVDAAAMDVEGSGEVLHEALRQAAEAAAVDLAFLEALPEELRVEVLSARGVELRLPPPAQQTPPQQPAIDALQAPPGTDPPPAAETAAVDASTPAPDAPAAAAAPVTEEAQAVPAATAAAAAQAAPAEEEEPSIDPEFLAALPVDIRQEVLAQQAADRRARATQRAAQQRQQEMGLADLLAAMDDDARADALGQLNDSDVAQLPPAMRTQAQALRERVARQQQVLQQQQAAVAAQRQQQHDFMLRHVQLGAGGLGGLVPGSNRLLIPLGADGLPLGGRNRLGPLTAALGGRGPRGAAGRAELLDVADQAADEPEGPPLLGEADLAVLIHLLRASLPISKVHLQKLLLNLVGHSNTREQLLKMLLGVLRSLPGASSDSTAAADADAEDSSGQPGASMDMSDDGSGQPSQQGLSAALDMLGSTVFIPVSRSGSVALADSSAVASSGSGKPAVVSRRVVDMLAYLSRHSQQVSVQMLKLQVPGPDQTGNGKGKLPAAARNSSSAPRALEVLLAMLSTPLCQRSISLLEQVALLLEVVLSGVQRYEADRAALAAMKEARRQQQEEENNKNKQEQQQPGADASNVAQAAQPQQQQQQQPTDRLIDQAAGSTPFRPGGQQPQPSDEQPQPQPQQPPLSELTQTLVSLQPDLLQQLPSLLALETLSESAYISIAKVIKLIVESALVHLPLMLSVLVDGVAGVANALLLLLDTATDKGIDADAQLAPAIGTKSGVVLRMLYALQGFQAEVSERLKLQEQQQQQDKAVEAAASRSDQHPTVAASESSQSAAVASSSAAGSSAAAVSRSSLDPVSESAEVDKAVASVASRTAPLWKSLSSCILRVEDNLRAVLPQHSHAAGESAGHAAARLLPPGAQQVLPLVEAFFVLCALQGAIPAAPGPAKDLLTAPSADQLGPTSTAAAAGGGSSIGRAATPLPSASGGQLKRGASVALDATDSALPFLRFAERHRRLLNAYIRRNTSLLESSLAPLLRVPRLIDFDNKRGYFKSKIRAQDDRTYAGGLRLAVKRSTVFEDSFNKLRSRTPAEMRGKLSVSFIGEEGIDAGGVSREWYQVMAREIFNPNLALFVSVPEGGTTFQPNPNSVVQSDTGVSHLEFFKFVGRLVGKALYDGQLMDAYFTRSFYKHMLGQQLTYEDIEAVDPEYYKNLKWMLENDITDVLDLTFTAESDFFGKTEIVELVPGGREVKVTEANKHEYVNLIARHRMTTSIKAQIQAFLEGFWQLVPRELISIFNDHELELLISGLPDIDVADLRANSEYTGYSAASPVIQWFWQVVADMDKQDLALLLQFVTGTSKVPLGGFKALQGISGPQRFQIHKSYGTDRLPSAHTCFNQLDLPDYESTEQLAERLAMAIHEGHEGFGFG